MQLGHHMNIRIFVARLVPLFWCSVSLVGDGGWWVRCSHNRGENPARLDGEWTSGHIFFLITIVWSGFYWQNEKWVETCVICAHLGMRSAHIFAITSRSGTAATSSAPLCSLTFPSTRTSPPLWLATTILHSTHFHTPKIVLPNNNFISFPHIYILIIIISPFFLQLLLWMTTMRQGCSGWSFSA